MKNLPHVVWQTASTNKSSTHVRGITLVELMIAITISIVILAVISTVFQTSKTTYNAQEGLARIQEAGRFSLDTLAHDIRQSGYFGCGKLPLNQPGTVKSTVPGGVVPNMLGVGGFHYTGTGGVNPAVDWTPPLSTSGYNFPGADILLPYSDVLVVRYATSNGITITNAAKTTGDLEVRATDFTGNEVGQTWMVTDCYQATFFQITGVSAASSPPFGGFRTIQHNAPNSPTALPDPPGGYAAPSELVQVVTNVYYVGDTGRRRNGVLVPALFRKAGADTFPIQGEELVEGIENMKVFYGAMQLTGGSSKTNYDTQWYVPADQISTDPTVSPNWYTITSVRVGVVATSTEKTPRDGENTAAAGLNVLGITTDTAPQLDNYVPTNANDGSARRVFTFVVNTRQPPK